MVGMIQIDIKKIIAYSTMSQLGYMLLCCGFANSGHSFYHLMTHALFKALLFLVAGLVIHTVEYQQDIRKMGGLLKISPLKYTFLLIGSLALIGFLYISGYYSKELIIDLMYNNFQLNMN
jgi:NADH:ubiquinone oxidoreductase subunit 5 (subunit L)/multisubunit Na+/H+ antiporter MnhA subunit